MSERASRRERISWYMYDFGNSAYAAVVLLAVYSAYFKGQVVGGAEGSRMWGIAVGIAMFVVAVISPIIGTIADYSGAKKKVLFAFTLIACIFTSLLFFVRQGDIALGMVFFIIAEVGYRSAQVFYNSLLPEIAGPDEIASVSGKGWAIGSAGGIICLLIILPLIMFVGGDVVVRLSLVITALFFAASTIPLFLWIKERAEKRPLPEGKNYLTLAYGRLMETFKEARSFKEFIKFVLAFLIYNDGVMMALDFAAIIGAVLFGMDQQSLIIFVIIVQVTNVAGAYVFGILADRWSAKRSLVLSIGMMVGVILWMFFAGSVTEFFFVGAAAGFAMAGIQSVSRTMVSLLSPEGRSAEFFGFFAVAGRTASFIGPAVYGILAAEATTWYARSGLDLIKAEQSAQRLSILSIGVFLLVGLGVLLTVRQQNGKPDAPKS